LTPKPPSKVERDGTARARGPHIRSRRAVAIIGVVFLVLGIAYLAASAYILREATTAHRQPIVGTPADVQLAYEEVSFPSVGDHITLRGWLMPGSTSKALVMVHGLDVNRWQREGDFPALTKRYVDAGFNVLTFDLRGHGESDTGPLGLGWYERQDVEGAVAYLEQRGFRPGAIGIEGFSYGAATTLLASAELPDVGATVADSPFADARELLNQEIARRGLPTIFTPGVALLAGPIDGLDFDKIPPLVAVPHIAPRPLMLIHGEADSRIPYENSVRLKAASRGPADELWLVPGAEHTREFVKTPDEYASRVIGFFTRYLN
jgi:pimeloyl-ACP methyl ester carboxylesterase